MARIQISNDPSGRIIVSFPYDLLLVEKVKSIDGRRGQPAQKYWSFLKLDGMLEKILKVFGNEEVHLDPALKGTVPDLRAEQGGAVESGLSLKCEGCKKRLSVCIKPTSE